VRDPAASLSLFPVEFEVGGHGFTVPAHPARRWVEMLLANDLLLMMAPEPEGFVDDAQARRMEELLLDGEVAMDDLRAALQEALGVVAGRDWWEAVGLVFTVTAEANWARLNGHLVLGGVDAGSLPFGAWLDAAMFLATQHMDEKQLGRFLGVLQTPPVEVGLDEEREAQAFLAMLNG
jgi:hypothetical protein